MFNNNNDNIFKIKKSQPLIYLGTEVGVDTVKFLEAFVCWRRVIKFQSDKNHFCRKTILCVFVLTLPTFTFLLNIFIFVLFEIKTNILLYTFWLLLRNHNDEVFAVVHIKYWLRSFLCSFFFFFWRFCMILRAKSSVTHFFLFWLPKCTN